MISPLESKKIWSKLIEYKWMVKRITITIENNSTIDIIFDKKSDLEKFREIIFNLMNIDIGPMTITNNQIILFLDLISDLEYFEKMKYPEFTDELQIFSLHNSTKILTLNNLPQELKKLLIITSEPFDITNLPNKLIVLDLSRCLCVKRFNLDFLPESLKILKLTYKDDEHNDGCNVYDKKNFDNLPIGLEEIYINDMFFSSTSELIEKYEIKKYEIKKYSNKKCDK